MTTVRRLHIQSFAGVRLQVDVRLDGADGNVIGVVYKVEPRHRWGGDGVQYRFHPKDRGIGLGLRSIGNMDKLRDMRAAIALEVERAKIV